MAVPRFTDWPPAVAGPLSELERIRSELDTLFHRFGPVYARSLSDALPAVHVSEESDCFLVQMDMSGIEEHEIELSASGNTLTVSVSQEIRRVDVDANHSQESAQRNTAQRTLRFPLEIDPEGMEATCVEGKLSVRLPKVRILPPRRITIRQNES